MKPSLSLSCSSAARRSASQAPPEWMPTMAACSTPCKPALTCCASLAYSASASSDGKEVLGVLGVLMGVVEILLQNNGGGLGVDMLAAALFDHCRGIALVDQYRLHAEAAVQLVGEAAAAYGHFMFGAVGVTGQADDAARRRPLLDQLAEFGKLAVVGRRTDDGQRLGLLDQGIADCHADAL